MANDIFEKWNKAVDGAALAKEVQEVKDNGGTGDYPEIPHGEYVVKVDKMELKASKKGDPMFSAWFKILDGEHKGSFIFMNQVITQAFQIHIVNEFLNSMETDVDVSFDGNYGHYNNMILDVAEACEALEFSLDYGENNKGFNTFKILEVYDA